MESTGIHMIIYEIQTMLSRFETKSPSLRKAINTEVNARWNYLWFLSIHYRFNKKLDTEFWRECRTDVDVSGIQELIDFYKENGLLSQQNMKTQELLRNSIPNDLFGLFGIDSLLLGQGVLPQVPRPVPAEQRKRG